MRRAIEVTCQHSKHRFEPNGQRCPACQRLVWELIATEPRDYKYTLRTTRQTYAPVKEKDDAAKSQDA